MRAARWPTTRNCLPVPDRRPTPRRWFQEYGWRKSGISPSPLSVVRKGNKIPKRSTVGVSTWRAAHWTQNGCTCSAGGSFLMNSFDLAERRIPFPSKGWRSEPVPPLRHCAETERKFRGRRGDDPAMASLLQPLTIEARLLRLFKLDLTDFAPSYLQKMARFNGVKPPSHEPTSHPANTLLLLTRWCRCCSP
jgi:hypothetical protein